MSTTIVLKTENGKLKDADFIVPIVSGDTVTFTTEDQGAFLGFGDETPEILTPSPANPTELPSASSVTYTFGEAAAKEYHIDVVQTAAETPNGIPADDAASAQLIVSIRGSRGSVNDQTGSGTLDQNG